MRALLLDYDARQLSIGDVADPGSPGSGQARLRIVEGGICGTDRGLASFSFGSPPPGERNLILGHEALARIDAIGRGVTTFAKGDLVVPMVRRSCVPACAMCAKSRQDNCLTGRYTEHGITGLHGYLCDFVLEDAEYLIRVPEKILGSAVLLEPASVVEKVWETALRVHNGDPRHALVLGAGAVGILAAWWGLQLGYAVTVFSLEPRTSPRAELLTRNGVRYTNSLDGIRADIVIEACGSAQTLAEALACLNALGVAIVLGAHEGTVSMPFLKMIIGNQIVAGSVNASKAHFEAAASRLSTIDPSLLAPLISRAPFREVPESVLRPSAAIKPVHVMED